MSKELLEYIALRRMASVANWATAGALAAIAAAIMTTWGRLSLRSEAFCDLAVTSYFAGMVFGGCATGFAHALVRYADGGRYYHEFVQDICRTYGTVEELQRQSWKQKLLLWFGNPFFWWASPILFFSYLRVESFLRRLFHGIDATPTPG